MKVKAFQTVLIFYCCLYKAAQIWSCKQYKHIICSSIECSPTLVSMNTKDWQGWISSRNSRGEFISLPFQDSKGHLQFLVCGTLASSLKTATADLGFLTLSSFWFPEVGKSSPLLKIHVIRLNLWIIFSSQGVYPSSHLQSPFCHESNML